MGYFLQHAWKRSRITVHHHRLQKSYAAWAISPYLARWPPLGFYHNQPFCYDCFSANFGILSSFLFYRALGGKCNAALSNYFFSSCIGCPTFCHFPLGPTTGRADRSCSGDDWFLCGGTVAQYIFEEGSQGTCGLMNKVGRTKLCAWLLVLLTGL